MLTKLRGVSTPDVVRAQSRAGKSVCCGQNAAQGTRIGRRLAKSPVKVKISSPRMHGSHFLGKFLQTPVCMHGCGGENSPSCTDGQGCHHLRNSRAGCLCPVPGSEDATVHPRDTWYPHPQTLKTDVEQHWKVSEGKVNNDAFKTF